MCSRFLIRFLFCFLCLFAFLIWLLMIFSCKASEAWWKNIYTWVNSTTELKLWKEKPIMVIFEKKNEKWHMVKTKICRICF